MLFRGFGAEFGKHHDTGRTGAAQEIADEYSARAIHEAIDGESLFAFVRHEIDRICLTARTERMLVEPVGFGRIAILREEGAITVDERGRLRVTRAGFPVLDAVVADLAA